MVAKVLSYIVSNVGNGTAESFSYFKLAWKMSVTTNQINIVWFAALIKITKTLRPFGQVSYLNTMSFSRNISILEICLYRVVYSFDPTPKDGKIKICFDLKASMVCA